MTTRCVLDSSVIAAIFFQEPSSQKAVNAAANSQLVTVDLARAEVANVAWKRVNIFHDDHELITQALKISMEFIDTTCDVIPTIEILDESFQIAITHKITFYDSLFLAASQREEIPLLTLDKRLANAGDMVTLL